MHLLINKINKTSSLYIATFLFFITCVAYINTLGNGLFYDDEDFIYNNVNVQHFAFTNFFTQNLIAGAGKVSNYYRPLLEFWFSLEWQIAGPNGFIYHLDSLLIHAAAGIALYILLKKLFNKPIALLTATLFIIHPLQTEAVAYASGRSDPMMAFFMFTTIILYLRNTKRSRLFSYLFLLFALLSRETAIITPAIIVLVDWYRLKSWKKVWEQKNNYIPYILIPAIYFFLRLTVLNFSDTLNFYGNSSNPYAGSLLNRLLTFCSILPTYFSILFFPKTLFIDRNTLVMTSLFSPLVLVPLFFVLISFLLSLITRRKYPILLFCFLWFFITISPTSGILPINGIIYEHFLYLPSIAIFLLIAYGVWQMVTRFKNSFFQTSLLVVISCLLVVLLLRTIIRNADWHDPITFYNQVITNNPNSSRIHNNLAMAYAENKEDKEAIREYQKAIRLADMYPNIHYNLANTYIDMNDIADAQKEYERTLQMDPTFYRAYFTLSQIYKATDNKKSMANLIKQLEVLSAKNSAFTPLLEKIKNM